MSSTAACLMYVQSIQVLLAQALLPCLLPLHHNCPSCRVGALQQPLLPLPFPALLSHALDSCLAFLPSCLSLPSPVPIVSTPVAQDSSLSSGSSPLCPDPQSRSPATALSFTPDNLSPLIAPFPVLSHLLIPPLPVALDSSLSSVSSRFFSSALFSLISLTSVSRASSRSGRSCFTCTQPSPSREQREMWSSGQGKTPPAGWLVQSSGEQRENTMMHQNKGCAAASLVSPRRSAAALSSPAALPTATPSLKMQPVPILPPAPNLTVTFSSCSVRPCCVTP